MHSRVTETIYYYSTKLWEVFWHMELWICLLCAIYYTHELDSSYNKHKFLYHNIQNMEYVMKRWFIICSVWRIEHWLYSIAGHESTTTFSKSPSKNIFESLNFLINFGLCISYCNFGLISLLRGIYAFISILHIIFFLRWTEVVWYMWIHMLIMGIYWLKCD